MKDSYVGDIGDFGKYGLLRALGIGKPQLRLGVIWYLTPDDGRPDGLITSYLDPSPRNHTQFETCDPELYSRLQDIVHRAARSVASVEKASILPPGTRFWSETLDFSDLDGRPAFERLARREAWFAGGLNAVVGCDLVFLDPDNGLETRSRTRTGTKRGPKYVFYDEAKRLWDEGHSLVIYQHLNRDGSAHEQVQRRQRDLRVRLGAPTVFALLFRRGTCRAFLILPKSEHADFIRKRVNQFMLSPWRQHFECVGASLRR